MSGFGHNKIISNEPWNTETHKTDWNPPIKSHKQRPFEPVEENVRFLRGPLRWLRVSHIFLMRDQNAPCNHRKTVLISKFESRKICVAGYQCDNSDFDFCIAKTYCHLMWHFCRVSDSRRLERIQERALRANYIVISIHPMVNYYLWPGYLLYTKGGYRT